MSSFWDMGLGLTSIAIRGTQKYYTGSCTFGLWHMHHGLEGGSVAALPTCQLQNLLL